MAAPRSRRTDLRVGSIDFANSNWKTHTFTTQEKSAWGNGTKTVTLENSVAQDDNNDYLFDLFVNGVTVPKSMITINNTTLTLDPSFYDLESSDEVYYNYIKAN